jgi:DNA-directed RNA polymerase subunit H (RpoH/RPB5)
MFDASDTLTATQCTTLQQYLSARGMQLTEPHAFVVPSPAFEGDLWVQCSTGREDDTDASPMLVVVVATTTLKLGVALLRSYLVEFGRRGDRHVLLITTDGATPHVRLNADPDIYIELLTCQQLQFNVLRHVRVPPHRLMSPEEVARVLPSTKGLPLLLTGDPVARALGLRAGNVVEIKRNAPTAIVTVYRLVAEG